MARSSKGMPSPGSGDACAREDLTLPGLRSGEGAASVLPYLSETLRGRPAPPESAAEPGAPEATPEVPAPPPEP